MAILNNQMGMHLLIQKFSAALGEYVEQLPSGYLT